jgi:hypothetical protein
VAIGVASARVAGKVAARDPADGPTRAVTIAVLAIGLAGAAAGQGRVGDPGESALPGQMTAWLRANAAPGSRAVMTFRDSEIVALELYGRMSVPGLSVVRVASDTPLSDFLWIGLRDRQLFGYTRSGWVGTLAQPETGDLIMAGPHPLTPAELMPALDQGGVPGVVLARQFTTKGEWASIYRVTPTSIRADADDLPLYLSPAAAIAWLDLTDGASAPVAARRLVDAAPVVVGAETDALARRLAGVACLIASPGDDPDSSRIVATGNECASGG